MDSALLTSIISTVGLLIPIGTLIWKAAKQSGKIETLETRVEKLEQNYKTDISEIKSSLNQINIAFAELRTSLNFIKEALKEDK